nr:MAG TPA: hypothetical protein [Caudoviricetes sp.]
MVSRLFFYCPLLRIPRQSRHQKRLIHLSRLFKPCHLLSTALNFWYQRQRQFSVPTKIEKIIRVSSCCRKSLKTLLFQRIRA